MAIQPIRVKLKVVNPEVSDSPRTYLSADVDASPGVATELQILSKIGFFKKDRRNKDYYYALVGDYNQEKTEIVEMFANDTDDKKLPIDELSNSHSASDPVTVMDYDKLVVYGDVQPGRDIADMQQIAEIDIDPTQSFTEYVYEYVDGSGDTRYGWFSTVFYDSRNGYSSPSSEQVEGTTFNRRSIKRIIESAAGKALTRVEEAPTSPLNWNICIDLVQDGIDEVLTRKRTWPFYRSTDASIVTVPNVAYAALPADVNVINFVTVDGTKVDYISESRFLQLAASGSTPLPTGQPSAYTIRNEQAHFFPTPGKELVINYDYYAIPVTLSELSDTVNLAIVPILIYYCAAMFAYIRGNDKRGDKMYAMFNKLLEQQVDEYTGPIQVGDAESVEFTESIYWE